MKPVLIVYGAYGHTGKFVVAELLGRGFLPILAGRNEQKLKVLNSDFPQLRVQTAYLDDPDSLNHLLAMGDCLINCAGPFLDTSVPLVAAAIRHRKPYLDISAEQEAVLQLRKRFSKAAIEQQTFILPAMAFYGGLADLLATRLVACWNKTDSIDIFTSLSSWQPTEGTRATGKKNHYQRLEWTDGMLTALQERPQQSRILAGTSEPQLMRAMPMTETITISGHIPVRQIRSYINNSAISDLSNQSTAAPKPSDQWKRSDQTFSMEVIARSGSRQRSIIVEGKDIYAISAPLVVEAATRILHSPETKFGVRSAGELFDPASFLQALQVPDFKISELVESVVSTI